MVSSTNRPLISMVAGLSTLSLASDPMDISNEEWDSIEFQEAAELAEATAAAAAPAVTVSAASASASAATVPADVTSMETENTGDESYDEAEMLQL